MPDMGDYWKLVVIQATAISPPSMFLGDLVTLLGVRSCCTQGDVVQDPSGFPGYLREGEYQVLLD